jgi:hypothetical protein
MLRAVGKTCGTSWKNIEFPQVQAPRADLLGETKAGELVHLELQSDNAKDMAIRMLDCGLAVLRKYDPFPTQVLLYVGEKPAGMKTELRGPHLEYSYRLVDVRDLDGERLLKSGRVDDNIVGLITRIPDHREAVRVVVQRIKRLREGERQSALARLIILAGLRKTLGKMVEEEGERCRF